MRVVILAERPVKDQCAGQSLARDLSARLLDHDNEVTVREVASECIEDCLAPQGPRSDLRQVLRLLVRNLRFASSVALTGRSFPRSTDVVFGLPPGAVGAWPLALFARRREALSWLHLERLETEIAFRLLDQTRHDKPRGLAHLARRAWANFENRALRSFQALSVPSEQMRRRLIARGVAAERVCVVPYWLETNPVPPSAAGLRQEFGIPAHVTTAVYAGPLTRSYALDALVETAHVLRQRQEIQVIIGGDGPEFPRLYRLTRNLPNVRLLALTSGMVRDLRSIAEIHLLPIHPSLGEAFVPPHLPSLFASGRPVVVAASPKAELYQTLSEYAVTVSIHQPPMMARAVADLAASPEECERLGREAQAFAGRVWVRDAVMAKWELELLIRRAASLPRGPIEQDPAGRTVPAQTVRKQ